MSLGWDVVKGLTDGGSHWQCLRTGPWAEAEVPMKRWRLGVGRGRKRQKGRASKHRENRDVYFVESGRRQGCLWVWRRVRGRVLDVVVPKERAGGAGGVLGRRLSEWEGRGGSM